MYINIHKRTYLSSQYFTISHFHFHFREFPRIVFAVGKLLVISNSSESKFWYIVLQLSHTNYDFCHWYTISIGATPCISQLSFDTQDSLLCFFFFLLFTIPGRAWPWPITECAVVLEELSQWKIVQLQLLGCHQGGRGGGWPGDPGVSRGQGAVGGRRGQHDELFSLFFSFDVCLFWTWTFLNMERNRLFCPSIRFSKLIRR